MIKKITNFLKTQGREITMDLIGICGITSLWYGIDLIYTPAAFIVVGVLFVIFAIKADK